MLNVLIFVLPWLCGRSVRSIKIYMLYQTIISESLAPPLNLKLFTIGSPRQNFWIPHCPVVYAIPSETRIHLQHS